MPRDTLTRRLAHEPFGWRPTTLLVTVRRYRCTGCGHVWRQDTSKAAERRSGRRLTRRTAADWRRIIANVLCCVVRGTTVRGQTSQDIVLFGKLSMLGGMLLAWLEQ